MSSDKQLLWKALLAVREIPLPAMEKAVLFALVSRCKPDDLRAWPGRSRLAQDAGIANVATVSRTVSKLEKKGLIKVTRPKSKSDKKTNIYVVFPAGIPDSKSLQGVPKSHGECDSESLKESNPKTSDGKIDDSLEGDGHVDIWNMQADSDEIGMKSQELVNKYSKEKPTPKAIVAFWWELNRLHYPELNKTMRKLTKHQFDALMSWFNAFHPGYKRMGFEVMAHTFQHWESASKYADGFASRKLPQKPSPCWMRDAMDGLCPHWEMHNDISNVCNQLQ